MATAPRTLTTGQMKDMSSALIQAIPSDLPFDVADKCLKRKGEIGEEIRDILLGPKSLNWRLAYLVLGIYDEYEEFAKMQNISDDKSVWTIPVVRGVTCNKVVAVLKKLGVQFYLYTNDLDAAVSTNDRDPKNGSYAVSFNRTVEADEENKNLSANDLAEQKHKGITLLERLLLELAYFLTTGKHLDEKNITLCTGSRDSLGYVPNVGFYPDGRRVCVHWFNPDDSLGHLRSRSVVSLPA